MVDSIAQHACCMRVAIHVVFTLFGEMLLALRLAISYAL